jgi:hypothetical protein
MPEKWINSASPTDKSPEKIHLDTIPICAYNSSIHAGMAEMADAADLKSAGAILVGSSPAPGTT